MSRNARYALAGLQAGISGAIGLLVWMSLASRFFGKSVWWAANLLATAFYGDVSLRHGFGRYTLTGVALVLFVYGLLGMLFGSIWRERGGGAALLIAALGTAVLAYYVFFKGGWTASAPDAAIYSPDRQIFLGHILFGFLLARYPRFRDRFYEASR